MGMHGHLTFLLLSLCAPGIFVRATVLPDLPRVVTLSEDTVPGTRVAEVTVSCSNSSSSPNVTLHSIEPEHPFNSIAISSDPTDATTFRAEVTLRAGAELDARRVNQYTLILRAACPGEDEVEERLFVRVTAGHVLHCDTLFASPEADVVQVLADVAPRTPLYVVLPQPLGGLTFRLRNDSTPLTLTPRGLVLAPGNGFGPSKDTQTFLLDIEVMDRHGHNCSRALRVEVLPSRHPRVTFPEPHRAVTVTEGIGPGEVVTQVHARGANVHYAILAPVAPVLFTIDEETGEIRSTRRLPESRIHLLIRAYNALHPDDHAIATVNVTVQRTERLAPRCVPAIFVSQVPETMSPGSTLVTLRCTGSTSADGCLHYALEGPPSSLSHFCMEGPQLKDSLEYSLEGGPGSAQPFSIDRRTGEIRVVGALDSQRHKSYRLVVRLTDTHHDLDPRKRQSRLCDVSVRLQAVPDQLPECTPEVQELRITAGSPGSRQPVTRLLCHGSPDSAPLTYTIVGGNEDGRFRMEGNTLVYLPGARAEPQPSVLLVEVGSGSGGRRRSSLVALVVQVTPRSTPVPASTTTQRTTLQKEPLVVLHTEAVWHPPAWFVAVLTISGVLLLATLGCTARSLLCSKRAPGKLFLAKSSWGVVEHGRDKEEQGHPHASSPGQLDGHAQDPRTGRDYLFRSVTGARRWI
ncbi:cadherin-related family member 4 isoform X3 [Zonotrichia leucophrys gambelii]|uniref:cadherin-related family member 4 isoform X3 n=1 Tax=Zonotrichia leucophrys gambelii TaxID=257770 RepID=UPI00314016B3